MAAILSVFWTKYGNPVLNWNGWGRIANAFYGERRYDIRPCSKEENEYRDLDQDILDIMMEATDRLTNHYYLPAIPDEHVRINHSIMHGDADTIILAILRFGIIPQPKTTGRFSECPTIVFGISDYPPGEPGHRRVYQEGGPYVTADVPKLKHPDICQIIPDRPGNTANIWRVEREQVIAVNGFPKGRYLSARREILTRGW